MKDRIQKLQQFYTAALLKDLIPFWDKEKGILFEYISPDGSRPDCFDGRLINPGHGIEEM